MNVKAINLYNYRYTEEFADVAGLEDPDHIETGVLAQELEIIIPEAVKTTEDVRLSDGEVIEKLKVINKVRQEYFIYLCRQELTLTAGARRD